MLVIDCDEYLTDLDLDGLCEAIETHPRRSAGMILRKNFSDREYSKNCTDERVDARRTATTLSSSRKLNRIPRSHTSIFKWRSPTT